MKLSAFAGRTIGIRRTFFLIKVVQRRSHTPRKACRVNTYKAIYKYYL